MHSMLFKHRHRKFHDFDRWDWISAVFEKLWLLQFKFSNVLTKFSERHYKKYEWAIVKIQRWYRVQRAQFELRSLASIHLLQTLAFHKQQEQIKMQMFLNDLLRKLPERLKQPKLMRMHTTRGVSTDVSSLRRFKKFEQAEQLHSYGVKAIDFPLTKVGLSRIVKCVRREQRNLLPPVWIIEILRAATHKLEYANNINEVSSSVEKDFIICGSLFGNLKDLLEIFRKHGWPSRYRHYIFNGDFVDYGAHGIEVLILILACFLVFDECVFLNRGDHEDYLMNSRYGFKLELLHKYPNDCRQLEQDLDDVFRRLPLATRIDNRVFIMHGGIMSDMSIEKLATIRREAYVSILCPRTANFNQREWNYLYHLVSNNICAHMKEEQEDQLQPCLKHAAQYFDADATKHFCDANKLDYIVTSNDYLPSGWQKAHNQQVWTVFSASNFYGINEGACLKLSCTLRPRVVTHTTGPLHAKSTFTLLARIQHVERAALHSLAVYLNCKRQRLRTAWQAKDQQKTGLITIKDWCDSMNEVSGVKLPWHLWQPKLAPGVRHCKRIRLPKPMVDFEKIYCFLDSEDVLVSFVGEQFNIIDMLVSNDKTLEMIFKIIDRHSTGYISLREFDDFCDILRSYLDAAGKEEQLPMLIGISTLIDRNAEGFMNFPQFLETFKLLRAFLVTKRKQALFQSNIAPRPKKK